MGDPICKWRNASVETIIEIVSELPKTIMSKEDFKLYMLDSKWGKAFARTVYQLACQVGLYYINEDDMFIPRFDHNIQQTEATQYMKHWIKHYYVPNPYTPKKFTNMDYPVKLMYAIADHVKEHPFLATLENACDAVFGETTGNLLCVKYILSNFSDIMEIDKENKIILNTDDLEDYSVWNHRYDKKAFFESFNR